VENFWVSDDIIESGYLFFVLGSILKTWDLSICLITTIWNYILGNTVTIFSEHLLWKFAIMQFHGVHLATAIATSQSLQVLEQHCCQEISKKTANLARSL
jgi:hypothetical protein